MAMNFVTGLFSKLQGGHETTGADVKAIAIRNRAFVAIHEGWLLKKGDLVKNWQKRYFLLVAPRTIFYFENSDKAARFKKTPCSDNEGCSRLAKGSVALTDNCVLSKRGTLDGKAHCFSVKAHSNSEREFVMSCESDADCEKWMETLRMGEEYLKPKPSSAALVTGAMIAGSAAAVAAAAAASNTTATNTTNTTAAPATIIVMQPQPQPMVMQPSAPPQMVMVMQQPQPQPMFTVVDGITIPANSEVLDAQSIRQLIAMFEAVQAQNQLQIQAILTRLAQLG